MGRSWREGFYEVGIWLLFVLLLVPSVLVGYAIGHRDNAETKTVTISQTQAIKAQLASLQLHLRSRPTT